MSYESAVPSSRKTCLSSRSTSTTEEVISRTWDRKACSEASEATSARPSPSEVTSVRLVNWYCGFLSRDSRHARPHEEAPTTRTLAFAGSFSRQRSLWFSTKRTWPHSPAPRLLGMGSKTSRTSATGLASSSLKQREVLPTSRITWPKKSFFWYAKTGFITNAVSSPKLYFLYWSVSENAGS